MTKNSLVPSLSSMSSVTVILFTKLIVLGFMEEEATASHQLSSYFDTTTGIIISSYSSSSHQMQSSAISLTSQCNMQLIAK